ncbi:MAG TPA: glycosyltransferase family 4 protein, partial [Anaeromyxobacteraceae bacterium]
MVRRGWRVVVLTSARGYEDPRTKYKKRQMLEGVEVIRLPLSSFGKSSIPVRLIAQSLFLLEAMLRALVIRDLRGILISTSPPAAPAAGVALSAVRRVPVEYWVMDLNPDQMVAMGKLGPRSLPARVFEAMNRLILRRASEVVVLDRFMADRILRKADVSDKITVLPPWPHEDHLQRVPHEQNAFRREHGLDGKFVVMYSGNHSPANPITTLVEAAKQFRSDARYVFLFVGGGRAKREVETAIAQGYSNIRSLPYQPLGRLGHSLSAADVHVVSLGNDMVGIVHPSKIYGAMAVGRPLLTIGPAESHLADLVTRYGLGYHVAQGDVAGAVDALRKLAALSADELRAMGERGVRATHGDLSQPALVEEFCRVIESGIGSARTGSAAGHWLPLVSVVAVAAVVAVLA